MGSIRPTPKRLAQKLAAIRQQLGLSQNGLLQALDLHGKLAREKISAYERGERVPSLTVLLRYARAAGVWVDVLIDDELDLPEHLPASPKHEGIHRRVVPRKRPGHP